MTIIITSGDTVIDIVLGSGGCGNKQWEMASDDGVLIIIYSNAAIIIMQEIEIRHTEVCCVSQEVATDICRMGI